MDVVVMGFRLKIKFGQYGFVLLTVHLTNAMNLMNCWVEAARFIIRKLEPKEFHAVTCRRPIF